MQWSGPAVSQVMCGACIKLPTTVVVYSFTYGFQPRFWPKFCRSHGVFTSRTNERARDHCWRIRDRVFERLIISSHTCGCDRGHVSMLRAFCWPLFGMMPGRQVYKIIWSVPTVRSIFFSLNTLVCLSQNAFNIPVLLRFYSNHFI